MDWGSEDMTETDDSEYEGSIDRENRLYVIITIYQKE